jgi:hypothetical protein
LREHKNLGFKLKKVKLNVSVSGGKHAEVQLAKKSKSEAAFALSTDP